MHIFISVFCIMFQTFIKKKNWKKDGKYMQQNAQKRMLLPWYIYQYMFGQRYCKHLCLGKPKWLGLGMDYHVENKIRQIRNRLKISKQSGFPCQCSLLLQPWWWQFFFFWSSKLPVAPPYWSFSFIWTNQQWHIGRAYWLMMYSNVIGNIACAVFFFSIMPV